jgi:hypothetical protein
MVTIQRTLLFLLILSLLLPACGGGTTPTLAITGQPTLVFIFTDP